MPYPSSRVEIKLRPNIKTFKIIIHLPFDLTEKEAKRIKDYIDTMVGQSEKGTEKHE